MSNNTTNKVSAASVRVKSYVRAKKVYPAAVKSVSLILSNRTAKELARNLLIVAFGDKVKDVVITGHQSGTVTVLSKQRPTTWPQKGA